jgi:siroheme synthase (precorrin-2 oxidase/ferrochelatase)
MPVSSMNDKQNITLKLSVETLKKAKVLAAQRQTSISGLLTQKIEEMAQVDDAYERARTRELARLRSGSGFDGIERLTRDEMHDRKSFR